MKDATITIRIKEQEKEQLIEAAARRDMPLSQLIREALREYIEPTKQELTPEKIFAFVNAYNKLTVESGTYNKKEIKQ